MFRNREFKRFSFLFLIIAAVSVTFSFVFNTAAGIISIISAAAFGTAFFIFTKSRYESIAQISDQIDLVLHNADQIYISESEEGELSIQFLSIFCTASESQLKSPIIFMPSGTSDFKSIL